MENSITRELISERVENKKKRLIETKKFLENYSRDLTNALGIGALVLYMSNIDNIDAGVAVKAVIGTVFVGCTVADAYKGSKIAIEMIDNKLETGFEEDIDYEMYKAEIEEKPLVKRLKK